MKMRIWTKKLLGVGLAVGLLVSTVGCQRNAGVPETTGAIAETTEETKLAMGSVGNDKTPEQYRPGKVTEQTQPSEGTEPTESQPKETQPTEPKATEPKATEPKATEPKATEPKATEPKHTHSYTAAVTAPTCANQGYTTHKCSCGDSYTDSYTAALGHSFGDWSTTREPTTEAEGQQARTCTRCGTTETRSIEKLPQPEPGVTEADIPALEAYGRSYAESVGFEIDTSLTMDNAGYYPAGCMRGTSLEDAKADIREKIEATKNKLIAVAGSIEGARGNFVIGFGACWICGGYGMFMLYG